MGLTFSKQGCGEVWLSITLAVDEGSTTTNETMEAAADLPGCVEKNCLEEDKRQYLAVSRINISGSHVASHNMQVTTLAPLAAVNETRGLTLHAAGGVVTSSTR
ncbi:hypothetical protein RRG08_060276 [Elysia crispata]|uniref:Uncharacterized protein n=1 Tax=Elysia crispata TaxID=231223 RepID=A0AAE1B8U8_9GAST|nr:hypothetical protein RRG08_060276 [Elysia crispata]